MDSGEGSKGRGTQRKKGHRISSGVKESTRSKHSGEGHGSRDSGVRVKALVKSSLKVQPLTTT